MSQCFKRSQELWTLIFGVSAGEEDINRWTNQNFQFSSSTFVLEQLYGGPCAVLAAVQGFTLIDLVFWDRGVDSYHGLTKMSLNELEDIYLFPNESCQLKIISDKIYAIGFPKTQFTLTYNDSIQYTNTFSNYKLIS
jgi:hypothetical protein